MNKLYALYDEIGQLLQIKQFDYEPAVSDFDCSWDSRSEYKIVPVKVVEVN